MLQKEVQEGPLLEKMMVVEEVMVVKEVGKLQNLCQVDHYLQYRPAQVHQSLTQ